jgi:preprotein translocase subunit SecA
MPMVRLDDDDEVYRTAIEKYRAIITLIEDCKKRGQPVLVGTTSIEKSEQLAEMLRKEGWEQHDFSDPNAFAALYSGDEGATKAKVFAILNARYHEQEAQIIAQAGVPGAITIATNMAGRGTDIQLGGNARFRLLSWIKEKAKAGQFAALLDGNGEVDERVKNWLDDRIKLTDAPYNDVQFFKVLRELLNLEREIADLQAKGDSNKRQAELAEKQAQLPGKQAELDAKLKEVRARVAEYDARPLEAKGLTGNAEQDLKAIDAERATALEDIFNMRRHALKAGGLLVLGTERHESRRIDNQLRGRSGRQGDPGRSKFFLSLEDDLMRIFGSDRLDSMLQRFGLKENEAIVHSWVNKALEKAQQKVEARNFDIRKNLLKFDNVMNDQRKVIFDQRIEWMGEQNSHEVVTDMRHAVIEDLVAKHVPENAYPEQWDTAGLKEEINRVLNLDLPVDQWAKEEGIADEELITRIERRADEHMATKVAQWGAELMRQVEKTVLLQILDHLWREHLVMLDHLRQVIGLRGYGQRDPLNEYKAESYNLFEAMSQNLREAVTGQLMRIEIVNQPPPAEELPYMEAHKVDPSSGEDELAFANAPLAPAFAGNGNGMRAERNPRDPTSWGKVGRNELCPCGSGKKFKHCHGRFA